jgi:hypothetical protein
MSFLKDRSILSCLVLTVFAAVFAPLLISKQASALTVNSTRDCDNNAVIRCGALTTDELIRKSNAQASARTIFHNFGITNADINTIGSTAVAGSVTSGGSVFVNGKEVAKNAMTAGRQNIAGSQAVTVNNVTFFKRPPRVSFASSSLSAFVVMKNGRFDFAIIASCGNPVTATAVVKQKQTSPPAAAVRPPAVSRTQNQTQTQRQAQTQTQSQTVVVNRTVAVAAPAASPAPAPQPQPKQIPNTGIGDVAGFGSLVTLFSAGAHFLYKRKLSA